MTAVAFEHQVCHKLHFHGNHSGSLTFLASSSFRVEREILRRKSLLLGKRLVSEELSDGVVSLYVCGRVRACALADGVLVYELHVLHLLPVASQGRIFSRWVCHLVKVSLQSRIKYSLYERRLARTAHSRNNGQHVQRNLHVYSSKVVHSRSLHFNGKVPLAA